MSVQRKRLDQKERFDRNWIPEPNSGCWLWAGWTFKNTGYGGFRMYYEDAPSTSLAHRAAWILYRGTIPDGMQVCHKCDVRCCVNPDHLFLGTGLDNMRDAALKGRMAWKVPERPGLLRGEKHHSTHLTTADVLAIRASTETGVALARRYGITPTSLSKIRRRLMWRHVP